MNITENYTTYPNAYIDEHLNTLPPNCVKLINVFLRKTIGWHKSEDRISYNQLMELTGIKSRSTISNHLNFLVKNCYVVKTKSPLGNIYSLNEKLIYRDTETVPEDDQNLDSDQSNNGTSASPKIGHTRRKSLNTSKETNKRKSRQPNPPFDLATIILPKEVNPESWAKYVDMRKDEGKPINTISKATGLISQLNDLIAQGQNPNLCLKHATDRCWLSIYAVKNEFKAGTPSPNNKWKSLKGNTVKTINNAQVLIGDSHAK